MLLVLLELLFVMPVLAALLACIAVGGRVEAVLETIVAVVPTSPVPSHCDDQHTRHLGQVPDRS